MSLLALRTRPDCATPPRAAPTPSILLQSRNLAPSRTSLVATMTIRIGATPTGWREHTATSSQARRGLDVGSLRASMAPCGLACLSGWYPAQLLRRGNQAELEAVRPRLALLRALGSRLLLLADISTATHADIGKPLSARPVLRPDAWPAFGARLTRLADAVASQGMTLAYHHHMGTIVQSRADIVSLMTHTGPSVCLLLDTGHAVWAGADPAEIARTYAHRIVHIQATDVRAETMDRARNGDWSVRRAVLEGIFTVPGDGVVDYGRVFATLPRYQGLVVLQAEQDPLLADPLDLAQAGYRHLSQVLAETGHLPAA